MHDTDPSIPLVQVIGGLSLRYGGRRMALPPGSHRLLAYLALHPDGVDRGSTAGVLWPTADDGRAAGSLRSALWRLQQVGCPLVRAEQCTLALRDGVEVDLARFDAWAGRLLSGRPGPDDLAVDPGPIADLELLPGWHDDWVHAVRERLHRRRRHALERLSLLRPPGPPSATPDAVHPAGQAGPQRDSGQPAPIGARRAAGDRAVTRQRFDGLRRILRREVGVEPSPELIAW